MQVRQCEGKARRKQRRVGDEQPGSEQPAGPGHLPQRLVRVAAQPVAGLAQSAERKQMESGNRRGRGFGCRLQAAHDVIRPGIRQEAAEAADLAAQRPHRITDAAAKRKFRQRGRRRRTGETDDHRQAYDARREFADPSEDR